MGRGISGDQKQILGLAATFADALQLDIGRGAVEVCEDGAKMMIGTGLADVRQPHCVHHVWGIPIDSHMVTSGHVGSFDNSLPGVKSAKAAASRALTRLLGRDLLRLGANRGTSFLGRPGIYTNGYVITPAGYAIGKEHKFDIDPAVIQSYAELQRRKPLSLQ